MALPRHRFSTLEAIEGLTLPHGVDRMQVRHHLVRRRFVREPRKLLSRIILHAQSLGIDWEEHVTEAQDQVILELFPRDYAWLFARFEPRLLELNAANFGLALSYWHTMRLNLYRAGAALGHAAHSDYDGPEPAKLAFTIVLAAPERGGDMAVCQVGKVALGEGDLLLFPAYEFHQVDPVECGQRISLTGWLGGPPLV